MNYVVKKHCEYWLLKRNVSPMVWEYWLVEPTARHGRGWYKKEEMAAIGLVHFLSDNRQDLDDVICILEGGI